MISTDIVTSHGPGLWNLSLASFLWVFSMLVILLHRAGIQIIGAVIALIGFCTLLIHSRIYLSLTLFLIGFLVHGFGRILFNLKRR